MSKKFKFTFAGIGSRKTPILQLQACTRIASRLVGVYGGRLYSGNAEGADMAFQVGAHSAILAGRAEDDASIIWLPHSRFNRSRSHGMRGTFIDVQSLQYADSENKFDYAMALSEAKNAHPLGDRLGGFALEAHARNFFQIHGTSEDELVDFVVCWTPDGAEGIRKPARSITTETGGTATAIRFADIRCKPVFNLANSDAIERLNQFLIDSGFKG